MQNQRTESHRRATRRWYASNKARHKELRDRWRAANKQRIRQKNREYRRSRLGYYCAKTREYLLRRQQAMPAWADRVAIQRFYETCPVGCHVDHIIPLRGRAVSGLHVLENLQYLPARDNLCKGNR